MPMNPISITISSVGTSRVVNLDWMAGGAAAVSVTGSSSGTFAYTLQTTRDDPMLNPSPTWLSDANFTAVTSGTSVPVFYSAPTAALRLSCSAISSAQLFMDVLQNR
jgi:hypothetical protein